MVVYFDSGYARNDIYSILIGFWIVGGFECVCPPNVTGPFCSEHLQPPLIISSRLNTTVEELVGIVSVVSLVFLLALSTVCFFRFQFKKHRRMHSHLQSHVMLHGSTGDALEYGLTSTNKKHKQKKSKRQQQATTGRLRRDQYRATANRNKKYLLLFNARLPHILVAPRRNTTGANLYMS